MSEPYWVGPFSICICIQQGLDSCPRHVGLVPHVSVFVFNKGWTVVQGTLGWSLMRLYSTRIRQLSKARWVSSSCICIYSTRVGQLSKARWVGPSSICIQQGFDSCPRHVGLVPHICICFQQGLYSYPRHVGVVPHTYLFIQQGLDSCPRHVGLVPCASCNYYQKTTQLHVDKSPNLVSNKSLDAWCHTQKVSPCVYTLLYPIRCAQEDLDTSYPVNTLTYVRPFVRPFVCP